MIGGHLMPLRREARERIASQLIDHFNDVRERRATAEQLSHGDKRVQNECSRNFKSFSERVRSLGHAFDGFMRAMRPIGSSSGLIYSSRRLKRDMNDIRDSFMSNSADLWREFSWGTDNNEIPEDLRGASTADISRLPRAMKNLSLQLKRFLDNLHSIPEFSDEPLMDALLGFHEWLHYRAERVEFHLYSPFRRNLTVFQYIEQTMKEMSLQVSKMEAALSGFVEHGVTAIQNAQKKSQDRLQNMSTVATFLSAVTATTVQYPMSQEHLETAVMGLWISSLILSIASAINAQLAIHWRASMYRSPRNALPVFALICLDHTPLLCLVGSVLAFSAGLVVWTFAAELALSVKISVGTITGVTFLVLIAAIIWEIMEWWRQDPTDTEEYLDYPESPSVTSVPQYPWKLWKSAKDVGAEIRSRMLRGTSDVVATLRLSWRRLICFITGNSNADPSRFSLPQDNPNRKGDARYPSIEGLGKNGFAGQEVASTWSLTSVSSDESDKYDTPEWEPMTPNSSGPLHGRRIGTLSSLQTTSPTRSKFQNAGRALMKDEKYRDIVTAQSQDRPEYCILRRAELQQLRPVLRLPIFHAPGHDIHFSPDGTRLAVSRLNQNLAIWEVGKYHEKPRTMPSPIGRFAWSPDSSHIVVIKEDGLNIWNEDSGIIGVNTQKPVGVVAWLRSSSYFIAVIDNTLHVLDTRGGKPCNPLQLHLQVHDVASIVQRDQAQYDVIFILATFRDEDPLSGSTTITKKHGKRPNGTFAERWLMIVDLNTPDRPIIAMAPTLASARHISVSQDGVFALVSYEDANCAELWRVQDRSKNLQLVFRARFAPPDCGEGGTPVTISGKARFCGEEDAWVMATDSRSDIHIWHRATGQLLHTLRGDSIKSKFPDCGSIITITSRILHDCRIPMTVVSACTEGVIIWQDPEAETQSLPSQGESSSTAPGNSKSV